ncbi:MAG: site-specific integrase [Dechloromonas sp.]|uniref:Site-specific integrase n=1 Tax=Candidatus Dechloromonas phosphorivorans TaxID=2899244 RepID=A0A9D7QKB6_9RHOO|nr:site-specific integrase [Candidatus Dechloromonas phosphorivorans]
MKAGIPVAKSDGDGLTFTLSPSGVASWVLRYRHGGKAKEKTIGRYPDISLADGRRFAAEDRASIQRGTDVAMEKKKAKLTTANAWTVQQLAEDYLEKASGRLATATIKGRRQQLRDYVFPLIGNMPAREVEPLLLVDIVERVTVKSRHVARLVLIALREVFGHGIARHVVAGDPSAHIKSNSVIGPRPTSRSRIKLSEPELRALLPALPAMGVQNALMVKILLSTATRIGELVGAKWEHIDFEKRLWTIPAENIKGRKVKANNGEDVKDFLIPMTPQVTAWFLELQSLAFGSGYVLPIRSRKKAVGDATMEPVTLNAAINTFCKKIMGDKCRHFTPHDLRSTARSHLGALGVDLLIAERCLNHSLGGLVGVYDQHDYVEERRKALMLLSQFIDACETGKPINVVPLKLAAV